VFKDPKVWLGLVIMLVLLAFSVRGVEWPLFWSALEKADWRWLALALPLYLGGYWSRARRVSQILEPIKPISTSRALPPLVIGFFFNNILPARLGEFVFAHLLGVREGISRSASLAAVVISRIMDGFTILAFFLFGSFAFLSLGGHVDSAPISFAGMVTTREDLVNKVYLAGILGIVIFSLVLGACFCLIVWNDFTMSLVDKMLFVLPERFSSKGKLALEKFVSGLALLKNPKALISVFLFNFFPWGLELLTYFFVAKTFGIDLNLRQCSFIMGMTNLAMIAPGGPGGIGPFETSGLLVMALYGLEKNLALAYIVVVHAIILLPINIWGVFFMVRDGITFHEALSDEKARK
jgi:uncharacterized protein (TIRG00374 family)